MARTPKTELSREEQKAQRDAAEQEALLREVDDAVRQGDFEGFMARYGKPLLGVVVLGLAAFGAYLFWDGQQEQAMEKSSEQLVTAFDHLEAGQNDAALARLEEVEGGSPAIAATMMRAGLASEKGDTDTAASLFAEVAANEEAPQLMRDLATIRRTALLFDTMGADEVVAAMKPLAVPGEAFFASSGELLAHAYLAQNKRAEAGALFAAIARDENTPEGARNRLRNMAGILGVDAVDDVQDVLAGTRNAGNGAALTGE